MNKNRKNNILNRSLIIPSRLFFFDFIAVTRNLRLRRDCTLKKIRYLLLSETFLGFPSHSETLKEFQIVTNTEFF